MPRCFSRISTAESQEATIMKTRKGMAAAALALFCAATASLADNAAPGVIPASVVLPTRAGFEIVYDSVVERRFQTRYDTVTEMVDKPTLRTTYTDEVRTTFRLVNETAYKQVQETVQVPVTETVMVNEKYTVQTPVYTTCNKIVCETISMPVCETIVKDCKTTCYKQVEETCYKEVSHTVCKPICSPVTTKQCFAVSKSICETQYRDVCKTEVRDVCETVSKDVSKMVCVPKTSTKTVCKSVPETVCETVCVKGRLKLDRVPKFVSSFDPCTCSTVQKECGTELKLVREPSHSEQRQVTRTRKIVEQVEETTFEKKTICEKQNVSVTKKVSVQVNVKVPVSVKREAQGAYADPSSLVPGAADAARNGERFSAPAHSPPERAPSMPTAPAASSSRARKWFAT